MPKTKRKRVHFTFDAPKAREVFLLLHLGGENIKKYKMNKEETGKWRKIIVLSPGRYQYTFIADGQFIKDPKNDREIAQRDGTINNEIMVYLPSTREI
jgi:5'-AMP-activated protein kinase regulatory beta subunit